MFDVRLLIATHNAGKFAELSSLLDQLPMEILSLNDVSIQCQVDEIGTTLEQNATLKAVQYAKLSGLLTIADDSGLEVDALDGAPGVFSSRLAGDDATDADRIAFLLRKLHNVSENNRTARFRSVVAIAWPSDDTDILIYTGTCEGRIIDTPRGCFGFGYDPIFLITEMGKTMAELPPDEKNKISHRAVAVRRALQSLEALAGRQTT